MRTRREEREVRRIIEPGRAITRFIATLHIVAPLALFAPLVLSVPAALAADEPHGGGGSEMMWQAINLAIVLGVLFYFGRKPVVSFFADRRGQIKTDLESAANLLSEAEARNAAIQRRLVDLDSQLEDIRETTRRRAEEESERILAEARVAADRIQTDAAAAAEQELLRAGRLLRAEAAELALELAGSILSEHVTDSDRDRLLDEFITRVEPGSEVGA
jgi:F-type H+-transporting ATPase subunit b